MLMTMLPNTYSSQWFSLFHDRIPAEQTALEADFVDQYLERGSLVLDVPCGAGRHALRLAERGHSVIAVDRSFDVLSSPPSGSVSWIRADMRSLPLMRGRIGAIICLWQSFGYFSSEENAWVLRHWADLARPGGCLVLDLYHRDFFEAHQGENLVEHSRGLVRETKVMRGDRLVVDLEYEMTGSTDRFEWQLFAPQELKQLALGCGWELHHSCSGFDRTAAADPRRPRVQYVLRRPAVE
jgi:SAM-dependent methyltransferase